MAKQASMPDRCVPARTRAGGRGLHLGPRNVGSRRWSPRTRSRYIEMRKSCVREISFASLLRPIYETVRGVAGGHARSVGPLGSAGPDLRGGAAGGPAGRVGGPHTGVGLDAVV